MPTQSTYTLTFSNGLRDIVLHVGQPANTSETSLTFVPKGYPNYGQFHQTNSLQMLEHFNGPTAPRNPITGQIWFDSTVSKLKVFDGVVWRMAGGGEAGGAAPDLPVLGQFWYNTVNNTLYYWSGAWEALAKKIDLITTGTFAANTITLTRPSGNGTINIHDIASAAATNLADTNLNIAINNLTALIPTVYAPINTPTFTGIPKAPTAAPGTDTTQLASTAFVKASIVAIPTPPQGLGNNQNWGSYSRGKGVRYYNTTSQPIAISFGSGVPTHGAEIYLTVGDLSGVDHTVIHYGAYSHSAGNFAIVPAGFSYYYSGGANVHNWFELR